MSQTQQGDTNKMLVTENTEVSSHLDKSKIKTTLQQNIDQGAIQTHTDYSLETQRSETEELNKENQHGVNIANHKNKNNSGGDQTAQQAVQEVKGDIKEILDQAEKKENSVSIQVGSEKKVDVLKNTEQTYAPQSCQVHNVEDKKQNIIPKQIEGDEIQNEEQRKKSEVEIQVGVSLVDEPEKVISKAKQQRILADNDAFSKFMEKEKILSENQKSVYIHIYQSIQSRKSLIITWHDLLKHHFVQYASLTKDFYEKCQKSPKEEKVQQMNKYLNIGEELKEGYAELVKFRQQSGHNHKNIYDFIYGKTIKDLERAYSKYCDEMSEAQGLVNDKKKTCLKLQDQFKKQGTKVQKMFNRAKQGKKEEDDFFIEISRTIVLEEQFRQALIEWGQQVIQLRKRLVDTSETYCNDVQMILNGFKTQQNSLYGIQNVKYDKVNKSRDEVIADVTFSKLIILVDADYIRFAIQSSLKKEVSEITDQVFASFVQIPQYQLMIGQPRELLNNMIIKNFALKDTTQQLINTVSGNLVLYNRASLQCSQKMTVKHIKGATTMEQGGIIEIQQKIPGIIFDSKKKTTVEFRDADRAEQLICFLGQGETNNL